MIHHIENIEKHLQYFNEQYQLSKYGRTKNIRDSNFDYMNQTLIMLERYITKNKELHTILVEGKSHFEFEEVFTPQFASREISCFLKTLKEINKEREDIIIKDAVNFFKKKLKDEENINSLDDNKLKVVEHVKYALIGNLYGGFNNRDYIDVQEKLILSLHLKIEDALDQFIKEIKIKEQLEQNN